MLHVNIICSFPFLQYISDLESTNVRIPPKEGHVINRSLLVFSVCRGGKIFGVGGKGELRETLKHSANVELQVYCFCKG